MSQLHILLVSDQLLGNIIPTLMDRPDEAALIVTPSMTEQAKRLTEILEASEIEVHRFDGAPDVELPKLEEFALDVVSQLTHDSRTLVLNLTGGTKLMAIGFLEVLRSEVDCCIYTDTAHGRLEMLPTAGQRSASRPVSPVLDVRTHLLAQGFRVRKATSDDSSWQEVVRERKRVCKQLAKHAEEWAGFLGALNALASQAMSGDELIEAEQSFDETPRRRWATAMDWLRAEGMLDWDGGAAVMFLDEDRTRFLNGGWLEEYVYHWLVDEGVDDVALGVTGTWDGTNGARNEFDVVAVHANRLLVVECKTNRHGRDEASDDRQLYKLDSLSKAVRGLFGHTWFVTAREPAKAMTKRATQHGIELLGPSQLPRLREDVQRWLG
ncbi:Card1-like endonuclease domain-containing protein [Arhodomonas sp. AD133]|uniref:Card1-like endonuclease domain-containing protein n=1 Tax=Arhodomonas sp. AD133 TaxID=3415009 RepID=UPI003EB9C41A